MVIAIDDIQVIICKGQGHRSKVKVAKKENIDFINFDVLLHVLNTHLSATANE